MGIASVRRVYYPLRLKNTPNQCVTLKNQNFQHLMESLKRIVEGGLTYIGGGGGQIEGPLDFQDGETGRGVEERGDGI